MSEVGCLKNIFKPKHIKILQCPKEAFWEIKLGECADKNPTKEIKMAFVVYKSGLSSPNFIDEEGKDFLNQQWKSGASSLTTVGMRQDYLSGKYFYARYFEYFGLINNKTSSKNLYLASTGKMNSISSSYSLGLGIFPNLFNVYNNSNYPGFEVNNDTFKEEYKKFSERKIIEKLNLNSEEIKTENKHKLANDNEEIKSPMDYFEENLPENEDFLLLNKAIDNKKIEKKTMKRKIKKNKIEEPLSKKEVFAIIMKNQFYFWKNMKTKEAKKLYFDKIKSSIPIVPSFSSMQGYSKKFGVSDLNSCEGAKKLIDAEVQNNKENTNYFINSLNDILNVDHIFSINKNLEKDFKFFDNFANAYFANIGIDNKNISQYRIPKIGENILERFLSFKASDIYYGDEKGFNYRAVISPFIKKFKKFYEKIIDHEFNSLLKIMDIYNKKKIIRLDLLDDYKKVSVFAIDEEIFWGFLKYISILENKNMKIPFKSSGVSFELYKEKNDFDLVAFIEKNSHLVKTYEDFISEENEKENDLFARKNKDFDIEKIKKEKVNAKRQKVKKLTISDKNVLNLLHEKFTNKDLFSVKFYQEQNLIFDIDIREFDKKMNKILISEEEIRNFCLPKKTNYWYVVSTGLTILFILLVLIIAFFYMVRGDNNSISDSKNE